MLMHLLALATPEPCYHAIQSFVAGLMEFFGSLSNLVSTTKCPASTRLPNWSLMFDVYFTTHVVCESLLPAHLMGLYMSVQLWCIKEHALHLAHKEEDKHVDSITRDLEKTDS